MILQQYVVTLFDRTPEIYVDIADDGSYFPRQVDRTEETILAMLPCDPNWDFFLDVYRKFTNNPNWQIEQAKRWEPHLMEF